MQLTVFSSRFDEVFFTTSASLVTRRDSGAASQSIDGERNWRDGWTFARALSPTVWAVWGGFMVFGGHVVWFLERGTKHFKSTKGQSWMEYWQSSLGTITWFSLQSLFQVHDVSPERITSRVFVWFWYFGSMILLAFYTANLVSVTESAYAHSCPPGKQVQEMASFGLLPFWLLIFPSPSILFLASKSV